MVSTASRSRGWSGSNGHSIPLVVILTSREGENHQRDRAEEEDLDAHRQADPPDRNPGPLPALVAVARVLLQRRVAAGAGRLALSAGRGPCHPSRPYLGACSGGGPRAPARAPPPGPPAVPAGRAVWSRPGARRDP